MLAVPRLESALTIEVSVGVGRVLPAVKREIQGAEYVALVLTLEQIRQYVVRFVSVADLSRLLRQQVRLVERGLEIEGHAGLPALLSLLRFLLVVLCRVGGHLHGVVEVVVALGRVVDAVHHGLIDSMELLVPERHLLARLHVGDACDLAADRLESGRALIEAHLSILDEEVELLLAVTDVILIETVVEVVARVLRTNVVRGEDLRVRLA